MKRLKILGALRAVRGGLFFLVFTAPSFAFAGSVEKENCDRLLIEIQARRDAQPAIIEFPNPGQILVFNRELLKPLSDGFSPALLKNVWEILNNEGTFGIDINAQGVMVASTRGSYGEKAWDRDHLRGRAAVEALGREEDAKKMILASMERYSKPAQLFDRIMKNLVNPEHYKSDIDSLPWVVFDPVKLDDIHKWSPQKDAYGLFLNGALDGILRDEINPKELTFRQKSALMGMFAMLIRIKFWHLPTTDAWEEAFQVYTGGVGLVTAALERLETEMFAYGEPREGSVFQKILKELVGRGASELDQNMKNALKEALSYSSLHEAINHGYSRIRSQLLAQQNGGEAPEMGRAADTSLLFLFYYRLMRFKEEDYSRVLEIAETLVRPAGMLRYLAPYKDGYLSPGHFFRDDQKILPDIMAVNHELNGRNIRDLFNDRKIAELEKIFGPDFSAQWPLGILMLSQSYAKWSRWFSASEDQAKVKTHRKKSQDYFLKGLGLLTPGKTRAGQGTQKMVALDGLEVDGFVIPEAYVPVRHFENVPGGERRIKESFFAASPFTPLKWGLSELALAFKEQWELEFPDEPFPPLAK